MRTWIVAVVAAVLLLGACGDSSDGGSSGIGPGGLAGDDDICELAVELEESDAFGDADLTGFDANFFDQVNNIFDRIVAASPGEIRADSELVRDTFRQMGELFEEHDFNIFSPELGTAMEALPLDELDAATERITDYVEAECGIDLEDFGDDGSDDSGAPGPETTEDPGDAFGNIADNPAAIQALMAAFGIDEETAQCLAEELPELDVDNPDPDLMTREVCGTTMLELITNASG